MQKCNKEGQGQFGINLAKDIQDNKKGFCQYIKNKKESVSLFLCGTETIVTETAEKATMLNVTLQSSLTRTALRNPWPRNNVWRKKDFPLVEEDWVRDSLGAHDIHKSMGPDGSDGSPTSAEGAGRHHS